jgi:dTDP-4-dehydrorhamnose reductase
MRNSKILVIGQGGQLGWELRHKLACFGPVASVDFPQIDLSNPESIQKAVRAVEPTLILNAAAYTAVDKAETETELAMAINGTAPGVLADEARRLGALLVHYSTDYVFDGSGQTPWVETDRPNPLSVYGKTKLAGDQAIQASGCDHLIFRTSWVYGARGGNFLLTMLRLAAERDELSIVDDQIGAPTTAECLAQATTNVLAQLLAPGGPGLAGRSGVYNMTNAGDTSWFGFAQSLLAKSAVALGTRLPKLVPIPTSQFPRPAPRPANSRLCCQRLEETFGVRMPHWEDALSLVIETLKEGAARVEKSA